MIHGENITLRTMREADLPVLLEKLEDIRSRGEYYPQELPSEVHMKKRFQEDGYWSDSFGRLLICQPGGEIVGMLHFFREPSYYDGLELGYILFDPAKRGQGVMTGAVHLAVRYLFRTFKINRLQILATPENIPSWRVAEKCGFTYEGTARGAIFNAGKMYDLKVYSLLRQEAHLDENGGVES
jgi:RimJ/RimL family protein N-acetyltransferase